MGEKLYRLRRQESAILAELAVARDFGPYILIDIENRKIELKARGRTLRESRILEGVAPDCGKGRNLVWSMTARRPLQEIERVKIAPGAGEDAAAEAALKTPWGPSRMPTDFDLVCEEGNVVLVRSLPQPDKGSRIVNTVVSTLRHWGQSYRRWRTPPNARPRCRAEIWIPEDQARLLFWSLPKAARILIIGDPGQAGSQPHG